MPNENLMSVSSNSLSLSNSDESELRPPPKKKSCKKSKPKYPIKIAHVPKRCYDQVKRRINKNKSVIDIKSQTVEKSNCNRFILSQLNSNHMEAISPESITRLVWEMKNCLQRQDYGDLAKLISMFTEMPIGKSRWYPTLLRYCSIVLLYDPLIKGTGLMDLFLEGVVGCRTESDKKEFLKDINRLPNNIHVAKYNDLWIKYPLPNQIDDITLDQLCETLNKRLDLDAEIEVSDDSDWESYDENDSCDESKTENETTEAENPHDLTEVMKKLQDKFIV